MSTANWTRADAIALVRTNAARGDVRAVDALRQLGEPTQLDAAKSSGGTAALRRSRKPGEMTKTEWVYAARLDAQKLAGQILGWDFEADKLKLADAVEGGKSKWKVSDFCVYHADGAISWDEVKGGFIDKAAMERFRWLCDRYPFRWFRLMQYAKSQWATLRESVQNERVAFPPPPGLAKAEGKGERC